MNLAFKLYRMPDESVSAENTRNELLRRVKGLAPQVMTLAEQEMNGNTVPFPMRVEEALAYYGALLESIQSTVPRDKLKQERAEKGLGRKLGNLISCEGRDRISIQRKVENKIRSVSVNVQKSQLCNYQTNKKKVFYIPPLV